VSHWIACVVIDHFAAGRLRQRTPVLTDCPVIVVQYGEKRAKVIASSADGTTFGIALGMPLNQARGFCPQAHFVAVEPTQDERALSRLLDTLWTFSNRVEVDRSVFPQAAVCYIDLGSLCDSDANHLADEMLRAVTETMHLPVQIGVATGKLSARLAAQRPNRVLLVPAQKERSFVAPFLVDHLPLTKEAKHRLGLLGLVTLGQFADLPSAAVLAQFGKSGRKAQQLARGLDGRPVIPQKMPPTEAASLDLEAALTSTLEIDHVFHDLAVTLEQRLTGRVASVHEMVLILTLTDGSQRRECLHLLEPVATTQNIERVLRQLLARFEVKKGVVRVEVQFAHLVNNRPRQLELFTHKPARQRLLDLTHALAKRYP